MKSKSVILTLVLVPWFVVVGMVVKAYLPVFFGKEYRLLVKLRDPRDFFRGNYVTLSYEFSEWSLKEKKHDLSANKTYRFGDTLWVSFDEGESGLEPTGLFATEPKSKIRLKVHPSYRFDGSAKSVSLTCGLESYFAPAKDAEAWEKALRQGDVYARVAIDNSGNARLRGLEIGAAESSGTELPSADAN